MERSQKISVAVVSNILGHGNTYDEWSTSFIIALAKIEEVESITIFCPPPKGTKEIQLPDKCHIIPIMDYDRPFSILSLSSAIKRGKFDQVIVIYGPSAFGNGVLSNLFGMLLPLLVSRGGKNRVKIINQGSTLTHDVQSLGYAGVFNKIKIYVVKTLEKYIYKRVKTYFQLKYYCERVSNNFGKQYVGGWIPSDFIDALASLYLNKLDEMDSIIRKRVHNEIRVLLHGFWGPQKDPETAMKTIKKLKSEYPGIHLTVSGGINNHFPDYREYFEDLIQRYGDVIGSYLGYVNEEDLTQLFLRNDVVLMPYRASGGQSGVLEMASFFENIVVCTDFPEFREEKKSELVILTELKDFEKAVLSGIGMTDKIPDQIAVKSKIETVVENIRNFISD